MTPGIKKNKKTFTALPHNPKYWNLELAVQKSCLLPQMTCTCDINLQNFLSNFIQSQHGHFGFDCHQNTNHGFTKFKLPGMSNDKAEMFKKFKMWEGHQHINRNWGLSSFRLIGIYQLKCYHPLLGKPAGLFLKLPVKKFTWLMDIVIKENGIHANFNQLFLCN